MPPIENANALRLGTVINDYIISDVLGSGGFGITYLATDRKTKKQVAIKEYMPLGIASRSRGSITVAGSQMANYNFGLKRFMEEAQLVYSYNHPNIVKVINFFQANQTAYMVMEYVGSTDLGQYLQKKGKLTAAQLAAIAGPLLDAVESIHKTGHLHRDIKPANILISRNGQPILLDFGAARRAVGKLSRPLSAIVSPGYSPFEQYMEDTEVKQGPWTDIYALAATFYKCISGKTPISAIDRKNQDTLIPVSSLPNSSDYPKETLEMIEQGLRVDMPHRPQSISDWKRGKFIDIPPEKNYAGFWKRHFAFSIDLIVIMVMWFIFASIMNAADSELTENIIIIFLFFITWLYFSLMESSSNQGSLGKLALDIKVTDLKGKQLSFGKAAGRSLGKLITFGIGFLTAPFTEKKQALHDKMTGCLVVNK